MSCRPKALAGKLPTRVVRPRAWPLGLSGVASLASKLAWSEESVSPKPKALSVPARAAYSHSASDSSR